MPTFDQYLDAMRPHTANITGRRQHPHPFLEREDLVQEAHQALWQIFRRYADQKPWPDLCRLGNTAIVRACITAYRRSRRFGAPTGAALRSLDDLVPRRDGRPSSLRLGETLWAPPDRGAEEEDRERWIAEVVTAVGRRLPAGQRRILAELRAPGPGTVALGRGLWRTRGTRLWASVRTTVLAQALGLPEAAVRREVDKIDQAVRAELRRRYTKENDLSEPDPPQRRDPMFGKETPSAPYDPSLGAGTAKNKPPSWPNTSPSAPAAGKKKPHTPRTPVGSSLKGPALRAARKAAGLCTACGKRKARPEKTECQVCADYHRVGLPLIQIIQAPLGGGTLEDVPAVPPGPEGVRDMGHDDLLWRHPVAGRDKTPRPLRERPAGPDLSAPDTRDLKDHQMGPVDPG